jgi:hypothetical protein
MSKFACTCGHIIVDNGRFDHIKGQILRQQSFDVAHEQPSDTVAEFMRAYRRAGARNGSKASTESRISKLKIAVLFSTSWTTPDTGVVLTCISARRADESTLSESPGKPRVRSGVSSLRM